MRPESVRVPLSEKVLLVVGGFPSPVDVVAAGFCANNRHDVLLVTVHPDPKFAVVHVGPIEVVPGAHSEMLPLVIFTAA